MTPTNVEVLQTILGEVADALPALPGADASVDASGDGAATLAENTLIDLARRGLSA